MTVIENVFICITAPILFAVICSHDRARRMMLFLLAGMSMCLLSSYISAFLAVAQGADMTLAQVEISPLVEEVMKFLPMLFYLLVFEPKGEEIAPYALMIGVGFATFENVCYLMRNESDQLVSLAIRGFSTGAMHVTCAYIVAVGLMHLWDRDWLRIAGTVSLIVIAGSYHAVYNILVAQTGIAAIIGYFIPLVTAVIGLILRTRLRIRMPSLK